MTEQPKDGGAAFPRTVQSWNGNLTAFDGMSLRDWFAGQALAGQLSNEDADPVKIAKWSYSFADAMIAAREATQ